MQLCLDTSLNMLAQVNLQKLAQAQHLLQPVSICDWIESNCTMPVLDPALTLRL